MVEAPDGRAMPKHKNTQINKNKNKWLSFGDWRLHVDFEKMAFYSIPVDAIAHKCSDGKVRGLIGPGIHQSKRTGTIKVYGRCRKCKVKVNDEMLSFINMRKNFGSVV